MEKGDCAYIFSDGFADQFGGPKGKKFKYKQLQELILSICQNPMIEQENILLERFAQWQGQIPQIDDICVIGVRV